jgi:hypothetical protein
MSALRKGSAAQQKIPWTERTKLNGIKDGSPMIQAIADSLLKVRAGAAQSPRDLAANFEYVDRVQLPQYMISVPERYEARIRDAFDGDRLDTSARVPASVTAIGVLDSTELQELSPGACAPFALGSRTEIPREVWAGRLFWASLVIQVSHLGETIIDDTPVIIVEPSICVRVRPYPDYDSTPAIRESLLEGLNQVIERLSKHLEHSVIADAFPAGEGRVPNNHAVNTGLLALNKGGKGARHTNMKSRRARESSYIRPSTTAVRAKSSTQKNFGGLSKVIAARHQALP